MNNILLEIDLLGLPVSTQEFAKKICTFEFSRSQIHGLFVLLGLYAGTPRTQDEMIGVIKNLQSVVPTDRETNIDEQVGDFYDGYEAVIDEFYLRSGLNLSFREIRVLETTPSLTIIKPDDNRLLDTSINGVNKLVEASRLIWSLLENLGHSTERKNKSLVDAFLCGIFQMQLYAQSDVKGSKQASVMLTGFLPLVIGQAFKTLTNNNSDYFSGLVNLQVPLHYLMGSMSQQYAEQMWIFQSCLFYHEQKPIGGVEELSPSEWHKWVLDRAKAFDTAYPGGLRPFSESGTTLTTLPAWGYDVNDFPSVDGYIYEVWGYESSGLRNYVELAEYKACLIYVVYASLTSGSVVVN